MRADPKSVFDYIADVPADEWRRLLAELTEAELRDFAELLFACIQPYARTVQADIAKLSRKPAFMRGLTEAEYIRKRRSERRRTSGNG